MSAFWRFLLTGQERAHAFWCGTVFENLHSNHKFADHSRLFPSDCSAPYQNLVSAESRKSPRTAWRGTAVFLQPAQWLRLEGLVVAALR